MRNRLEVGDFIVVSSPLFGDKEYEVLSIDENKAKTKWRVLNSKIYPFGRVYEYGKRYNPDSFVSVYAKKFLT